MSLSQLFTEDVQRGKSAECLTHVSSRGVLNRRDPLPPEECFSSYKPMFTQQSNYYQYFYSNVLVSFLFLFYWMIIMSLMMLLAQVALVVLSYYYLVFLSARKLTYTLEDRHLLDVLDTWPT